MTDRDPRDELRRRLDAGEISATDAERVLAALAERRIELEVDRAALRAAERPGTMTWEETRAVVEAMDIPEAEITAMMDQLGLEPA